jgi:hypothetical protein
VDNLFDNRIDVRDATPSGHQSDLLDPPSLSIQLSFRKLFF